MIRATAGVAAAALLAHPALAGDLAEIKAGGVLRLIAPSAIKR